MALSCDDPGENFERCGCEVAQPDDGFVADTDGFDIAEGFGEWRGAGAGIVDDCLGEGLSECGLGDRPWQVGGDR